MDIIKLLDVSNPKNLKKTLISLVDFNVFKKGKRPRESYETVMYPYQNISEMHCSYI